MFTLWLQIWGDTAMHVSDMRSWTWTCRRSTLDWQPMPSTIGASRVLACLFSRWHVSAFQRKGVAARSQGSQWTQPVNAVSKRTISSDITCTLKTSICLAHLFPSLTRSSSPFALCVLSHTSSCSLPARQLSFFLPLSLSFPPVYHTHTPPPSFPPLSLWLSLLHLSHFQAVLSFTLFLPIVLLSHVCLTWFDI